MYSSQGVDMPAEQTINKRVSKLEERDDCDSYVSDSEEEDSDNGNWEIDSDEDSLEEAGII